jgi:hypothetical protein
MLAQARRDDPAVAAGRRHSLRALSAHTRLEPRSLAAPVSARPPRLVSHVRGPPCQRTATVASIIVPSELNRKGGGVASARASASRMLAWGALLGGAPTPLRLPRSCLAAAPCPPPRALTLATPALHAPCTHCHAPCHAPCHTPCQGRWARCSSRRCRCSPSSRPSPRCSARRACRPCWARSCSSSTGSPSSARASWSARRASRRSPASRCLAPPPRTHAPPGPPGRKTARRALRASRPAPRWATTRRVTRGEHATRGGRITRGGRARGSRCAAAGWQVLATVALIAALRLAPPGLNSVWACFFLFNGIRFFNVVRFHFFTGPLVAKNAR